MQLIKFKIFHPVCLGMDMVSFDVKSVFTNVPIKKAINVKLKGIYNNHTIRKNLKKHTLDAGIKTA